MINNNASGSNQLNTQFGMNPVSVTENTHHEDLPRLGKRRDSGRRKSVSFNEKIAIEDVENWKKYNHDSSLETEFYKLKQEIKQYKEAKAKKEQNCCCIIF